MGRLSPENRTALTLLYLDGVSIREAAELLGWNSVLLRVRVHRAKQQLRKVIGEIMQTRDTHERES